MSWSKVVLAVSAVCSCVALIVTITMVSKVQEVLQHLRKRPVQDRPANEVRSQPGEIPSGEVSALSGRLHELQNQLATLLTVRESPPAKDTRSEPQPAGQTKEASSPDRKMVEAVLDELKRKEDQARQEQRRQRIRQMRDQWRAERVESLARSLNLSPTQRENLSQILKVEEEALDQVAKQMGISRDVDSPDFDERVAFRFGGGPDRFNYSDFSDPAIREKYRQSQLAAHPILGQTESDIRNLLTPVQTQAYAAQTAASRRLGLSGVIAIPPQEAQTMGLLPDQGAYRIGRVMPDTTAARTGLQEGDVIVEWGWQPLPHGEGYLVVRQFVQQVVPNTPVPLTVLRNGQRVVFTAQWDR